MPTERRHLGKKSWLFYVTPRKFLCHYPLWLGSYIVGGVMAILMMVIICACTVQVVKLQQCEHCPDNAIRVSKGFSITAVIYSFLTLIINVWLFYGIHKRRATIVGGYVAITIIWYIQTFSLLLTLIFLYSEAVSLIAWINALIFGLIALGMILYGLLVILGYWLELKSRSTSTDET